MLSRYPYLTLKEDIRHGLKPLSTQTNERNSLLLVEERLKKGSAGSCKERVPRAWPTGHINPSSPAKDRLCFGHFCHVPQALRAAGGVGDVFILWEPAL